MTAHSNITYRRMPVSRGRGARTVELERRAMRRAPRWGPDPALRSRTQRRAFPDEATRTPRHGDPLVPHR
jgi:hypothetical protein